MLLLRVIRKNIFIAMYFHSLSGEIKRKTFNALRNFPRFIMEEREREKRRSEMRKKVASMLPDFEVSKSTRSSVTSSIGDIWKSVYTKRYHFYCYYNKVHNGSFTHFICYSQRHHWHSGKQVCIPIGCASPTCWTYPWWGRGVCIQGVWADPLKVCLQGGVVAQTPQSCHLWCMQVPPMDRQTPVKTLPCPKLRLRVVTLTVVITDMG